MSRKKQKPWGDLIGDKPIERSFRQDDPRHGEAAQKEALAEQFKRVCRIKESYGIEGTQGWRPWYDLAVALIAERNDAVEIIDPQPDPRDAKWHILRGLLFDDVAYYWEEQRKKPGGRPTVESVIAELQSECALWSEDKFSFKTLMRQYQEEKARREQSAR